MWKYLCRYIIQGSITLATDLYELGQLLHSSIFDLFKCTVEILPIKWRMLSPIVLSNILSIMFSTQVIQAKMVTVACEMNIWAFNVKIYMEPIAYTVHEIMCIQQHKKD